MYRHFAFKCVFAICLSNSRNVGLLFDNLRLIQLDPAGNLLLGEQEKRNWDTEVEEFQLNPASSILVEGISFPILIHHLSIPLNLFSLYFLLMRRPPPQAASMCSQIPCLSQISEIKHHLFISILKKIEKDWDEEYDFYIFYKVSESSFTGICIY